MKCWYILSLFLLSTLSLHSQSAVQTFVDRCTGETKTIVIPFEGSTVVVFYNRSRSFTINDLRSGELQAWLEETYLWWQNISPCSTNQATTTTTQNTAQNATQNATSSASSSASPPDQGTSSTSQSSSTETSTNSAGETTESSGSNNSGSDGNNQEGDSSSGNETSSEEKTSSEEQTETEEQSEPEEQSSSEEESDSEESSEGDSEDDGEDSDDGEESEEKDSKKSNKKSNPVIVAANVATMSALDGSVNFVTNVGLSQASLSGIDSYSLNVMVWDNLRQYNVNLAKSTTNKEQLVTLSRQRGVKVYGGGVKNVTSSSVNIMYSFGMINLAYGKSKVYILDKGYVAGWAANLMGMKMNNDYTFLPTLVGFGTKPFTFSRFVVSPMVAVAFTPIMYNTSVSEMSTNINPIFVVGYSGSFNLTKNFYLNLGFNIVESTANIPLTWAATIGSRFQF